MVGAAVPCRPHGIGRGDQENVERGFRQDLQDGGKWDIRDNWDTWDCRGCRVRRGRPVWRPSREGRRWGTAIPLFPFSTANTVRGRGGFLLKKGWFLLNFLGFLLNQTAHFTPNQPLFFNLSPFFGKIQQKPSGLGC